MQLKGATQVNSLMSCLHYVFRWIIYVGHVGGSLHRDTQTNSIDASKKIVAKFIIETPEDHGIRFGTVSVAENHGKKSFNLKGVICQLRRKS